MKRLALILTLLVSLPSFAQEIPLLEKVQGKRVSFLYSYYLSRDGDVFTPVTSGSVMLEDSAYVLEGMGLVMTSDGETRLSVDHGAREAVLENVNFEDMLTNPALFISSYRNYPDRISVNSQGEDSLDVTLTLDDETFARFVVTDVVIEEPKGKSDFVTDTKSLPSDYIVTDLR